MAFSHAMRHGCESSAASCNSHEAANGAAWCHKPSLCRCVCARQVAAHRQHVATPPCRPYFAIQHLAWR
eukprot:5726120-Pleurochrysis_carterae.AAC.2